MIGTGPKFIAALLWHLWGVSTAVSMGRQSADFSVKERGLKAATSIRTRAMMDDMFDKVVAGSRSEKIMPFPYEQYKLENNDLEVIIVPLGNEFPGIVSLHTLVKVGSRDEVDEGTSGMAHFFEHMMFRGTNNVSGEEYSRVYDEMGANINAFTARDYTNFFALFPGVSSNGDNNLEMAMFLESDRFKHINYTEDAFKLEAGAILGEYNQLVAGNTLVTLGIARNNLSYSVHPYKHHTLGTVEDIRDMPNEFEYSKLFFERFYKPENAVLMVFGDVDVNETKALVNKYYSDWKGGQDYVSNVPQEAPRDTALYEHVDWDGPTPPLLSLSFTGTNFTLEEPDLAALDIISATMFSTSSDLFQRLINEERVAFWAQSGTPWRKDPANFAIDVVVADASLVWYVRDEILQELAKTRVEPLPADKIEVAKSRAYYTEANDVGSVDKVALLMVDSIGLGSPEAINDLYALYETITPEIAQEVANKYFTDERLATVTMAYGGDTLPEPPTPLFPGDNALAGSVDSFVAALSVTSSAPTDSPNVATPGFSPDKVIIQSTFSKLVDFDIRFRVGSTDDPDGKDGLAALTAACIYDGRSASLGYEEIQDVFTRTAATFSGTASKEYTAFKGRVHSDNLNLFYEVISEMLLIPRFHQEDFEFHKTDMIGSAQQKIFDEDRLSGRALSSSVFQGHPYSKLGSGSVESLLGLTIDDVKDFYTTHYTKQNLILGLAGAVSEDFSTKVLSDLTNGLPDGVEDKTRLVGPPARTSSNAVIIERNASETTTLDIGYSFPTELVTRGHPDYGAMMIAQDVLSGGRLSILIQEIREKRGINYDTYAGPFQEGLGFAVGVGAVESAEAAHFAARLVMFQLKKLINEGVSQDTFERLRNKLYNNIFLTVDTPAAILDYGMDGVDLGYGTDFLSYARSALSNTTLDDVNAAIKKWHKAGNVTFVFVTPDAEDLKERLANDEVSTITYATESQPEDVLLDDEKIKSFPLELASDNIEIKTPEDLFPGYDMDTTDDDDYDDDDDDDDDDDHDDNDNDNDNDDDNVNEYEMANATIGKISGDTEFEDKDEEVLAATSVESSASRVGFFGMYLLSLAVSRYM